MESGNQMTNNAPASEYVAALCFMTDGDLDLAQFAIVQLAEMTERLLAKYDRLWDKARAA
jgi:hypothetical protein